jgi:hypothetical protein
MIFAFPQQSLEKRKIASVKSYVFSDKTPCSLLKVNRLHHVIFQKIEIFISTTVKPETLQTGACWNIGRTAIMCCFNIVRTKVYVKSPHFESPEDAERNVTMDLKLL